MNKIINLNQENCLDKFSLEQIEEVIEQTKNEIALLQ